MHTYLLYIAFTTFDVLAVVTTLGVLACWLAVLPEEPVAALESAVHRLLGTAVALLTLSSAGILASRTLEMDSGQWTSVLSAMPIVLKVTHYGHVWLFRLPALISLWYGWSRIGRHRRHRWLAWMMIAAVAAIALTRSESGHPADNGDFTFGVWIDWLHLIAGSVWVGSLFGMSLAVFPQLRRTEEASPVRAAEIFQRLSRIAGYGLGIILLTGVYTAWHELGGWSALWTSQYGRVLSVKLLLVAVMIGFGAHNRYVRLPCLLRAARKPGSRPFLMRCLGASENTAAQASPNSEQVVRGCAHAIRTESLLGVGVIVAASFLLHGMPAVEMHGMPMSRSHPPASLCSKSN